MHFFLKLALTLAYVKKKLYLCSAMKRSLWIVCLCALVMTGCDRPSKAAHYRAEKHARDSVALEDQLRSLAYYQSQWETLTPMVDSLLPLFVYEKNEKYQDHGFYVAKGPGSAGDGLRIMVRDDGRDLLLYKNGKRLTGDGLKGKEAELLERAEQLQIAIRDIRELEKRMERTSLEVQKYQKRIEKH